MTGLLHWVFTIQHWRRRGPHSCGTHGQQEAA
ncbi:hypothetical protein Nmel_013112 [Mimus melanotis]